MKEFFHGWRRKAGVVTLTMALAISAGWIRSRVLRERESIRIWQGYSACSGVEGLGIERIRALNAKEERQAGSIVRYKGGFLVETKRWVIPYWQAAVPLTLLSAYLILWKPLKRVP